MIWAIFFSVTSLYLWNASHFSRANKITIKNYRYITLSIDSNDISIDTTSHILEEDPGHLIWVSARHPTSGDDEGTQSGTKVGKIFHIWIFKILIIAFFKSFKLLIYQKSEWLSVIPLPPSPMPISISSAFLQPTSSDPSIQSLYPSHRADGSTHSPDTEQNSFSFPQGDVPWREPLRRVGSSNQPLWCYNKCIQNV